MPRAVLLLKGLVSGALWSLIPIVFFGDHFGAFNAAWMLASGSLVGIAITLVLWYARIGSTRASRLVVCVPVLLASEALWAFLVTLPATREGNWPERWYELTLGIYWMNLFSLLVLVLAPITYWNLAWVKAGAPSKDAS